ncbi:uncharacterized protein A4U43_C08F14160 [Asparagus officinalis]|nr:uncharacterized protein A4U43_C08F14160 [Asparagus officinalis]
MISGTATNDMISTLTSLVLTKPSAGSDRSAKIITVVGENVGATMKMKASEMKDTSGVMYSNEKTTSAVMNSNYQAVNNSVMFKGRCVVEDPSVHVVISDHDDYNEDQV